jgi:hypothetical protein
VEAVVVLIKEEPAVQEAQGEVVQVIHLILLVAPARLTQEAVVVAVGTQPL